MKTNLRLYCALCALVSVAVPILSQTALVSTPASARPRPAPEPARLPDGTGPDSGTCRTAFSRCTGDRLVSAARIVAEAGAEVDATAEPSTCRSVGRTFRR